MPRQAEKPSYEDRTMDQERVSILYNELRECIIGIRRLENALRPDLIHNLAQLYQHKARIMDELVADPLEQMAMDLDDDEDLMPTERAALTGQIEAMQAQIASMQEKKPTKEK